MCGLPVEYTMADAPSPAENGDAFEIEIELDETSEQEVPAGDGKGLSREEAQSFMQQMNTLFQPNEDEDA